MVYIIVIRVNNILKQNKKQIYLSHYLMFLLYLFIVVIRDPLDRTYLRVFESYLAKCVRTSLWKCAFTVSWMTSASDQTSRSALLRLACEGVEAVSCGIS